MTPVNVGWVITESSRHWTLDERGLAISLEEEVVRIYLDFAAPFRGPAGEDMQGDQRWLHAAGAACRFEPTERQGRRLGTRLNR